jgi:hypothetical protein
LARALSVVSKESALKTLCKPLIVMNFFWLPSDGPHGNQVKPHASQVKTHGKWEKRTRMPGALKSFHMTHRENRQLLAPKLEPMQHVVLVNVPFDIYELLARHNPHGNL